MPWTWIILAALAFGPAALVLKFGGKLRWMLLGIASWFIAVCIKTLLAAALESAGSGEWPALAQGAVSGVLSAICELGLAMVFLRKASIRPIDAIGFGCAIGSFEIVFTLGLGMLEGLDEQLRFDAHLFDFVTGLFVFERAFAIVGHTASRTLVFLALRGKKALPAAIAFAVFSCVDGLAAYGLAADWNWDDNLLHLRFQIAVACLAVMEAVAAVIFLRTSMQPHSPARVPGDKGPA